MFMHIYIICSNLYLYVTAGTHYSLPGTIPVLFKAGMSVGGTKCVFVNTMNVAEVQEEDPHFTISIVSTLPYLRLSKPHTAVVYIRDTECMCKYTC